MDYTIGFSIFALIVAILILFNERKSKNPVFAQKIFILLVHIAILLLFADSVSWLLNARRGNVCYIANKGLNFILFLFSIVPAVLWYLYVDFQLYGDTRRIKKALRVFVFPVALNTALTIVSLFNGWFFYVDSSNNYHRGPLFLLNFGVCFSILLYTSLLTVIKRSKTDNRTSNSMMIYPLPQIAGCLLQAVFFGQSLIWSSMVISLLIIYFNIQNYGINTDHLTGVLNRRFFDTYLKFQIENRKKQYGLSVIFFDIDDFKEINDNFGHTMGDDALKEAAKLLSACADKNTRVTRYGGDEFCIIVSIKDESVLDGIIDRINKAKDIFNLKSKKPYSLYFSVGYDVYDYDRAIGAEEFMKRIDRKMYEQKKEHKLRREALFAARDVKA